MRPEIISTSIAPGVVRLKVRYPGVIGGCRRFEQTHFVKIAGSDGIARTDDGLSEDLSISGLNPETSYQFTVQVHERESKRQSLCSIPSSPCCPRACAGLVCAQYKSSDALLSDHL